MGVIVPVGEVQVVLRWLVAGDPEEMVSTFGLDGLGPYSSADALAVTVSAAATAQLCPSGEMASGYTFVGTTVYVKQDDGDSVVGESVVTEVGVGSWDPLPNNCAFLVKKSTDSAGPDARGRMFLPPYRLGEDDVSPAGIIGSAARNSLQTDVEDFVAALTTAYESNPFVLFHSDGSPSTPITGWNVDPKIATVRRRMRR